MKSILLLTATIFCMGGCALDNNSGDSLLSESLLGSWQDRNIDILGDGRTLLMCDAVTTYHDDNTSSTSGKYTLNSPDYGNVVFNIDKLVATWELKNGILTETITDCDLSIDCSDQTLADAIEDGAKETLLAMKPEPFTIKKLDASSLSLVDGDGEETHYKRL